MPYDLNYLNQQASNLAANRQQSAAVRPATNGLQQFSNSMASFAKGAKQLKNMRSPTGQAKNPLDNQQSSQVDARSQAAASNFSLPGGGGGSDDMPETMEGVGDV